MFETIEALKDKDEPMDIARAKAVSEVAQTIINSAKVEVDFLNVTQRNDDAGFLSNKRELPPAEVKSIGKGK